MYLHEKSDLKTSNYGSADNTTPKKGSSNKCRCPILVLLFLWFNEIPKLNQDKKDCK
jgi:hypothetical protein